MGNPAETLERIQAGSVQMIALVKRRVTELENRLAEGDFNGAFLESQQLCEKLHHLAHAQNTLGILANSYVVKVRDLEEGMVLAEGPAEGNVITKVEPCPCPKEGCEQLIITVGNDDEQAQVLLGPDVEMVVQRD